MRRPLALIFALHEDSEKSFYNDERELVSTLKKRGFEVKFFKDLTYMEFLRKLEKVSEKDHSGRHSLWVFVIARQSQGVIHIKGRAFPISLLFDPFSEDKCPTLADKPKIFIIQGCRGQQTDTQEKEMESKLSRMLSSDENTHSFPVLTQKDMLVFQSPFTGDWPSRRSGFFKAFCEKLNLKEDLEIPEIFQHTMSSMFENESDNSVYNYLAVPVMCSSLTKKIFLNDANYTKKVWHTQYIIIISVAFVVLFILVRFYFMMKIKPLQIK